MEIQVDPEFKSLIPPLSAEELSLLEENSLAFKGDDPTGMKFMEVMPSTMGNLYWFFVLNDLNLGIQEYTKRPIALSRIKTVNFLWNDKFSLKPEFCSPLPIDYFDVVPKAKTRNKTTNIYFIQSVIGGPVKIGTANNIEVRIKQHQTGSPFTLKIIKTIENVSRKTERELHKIYSDYRVHGEWFSEEILKLNFEVN